jgi:hypothetical protein
MSNICLPKRYIFLPSKFKIRFLLNKTFVLTKIVFMMALRDKMGRLDMDCHLLLLVQSCCKQN